MEPMERRMKRTLIRYKTRPELAEKKAQLIAEHEATRVHCTGQQRGTFHAALLFSFRKCANCRFQSSRPTPRASRPRAERASKKPAETAGLFVPPLVFLSPPPWSIVVPIPTPP